MNFIEHISERNRALVEAYYRALKAAPYRSKADLLSCAVSSRAPRFYCSLEEAHRNCSKILRGLPLARKSGLNEKMYREIACRVEAYRGQTGKRCLRAALLEIIYSEAPEFYITPEYAQQIINKSYKCGTSF